jgi:predicted O-methyltransferase YrrM
VKADLLKEKFKDLKRIPESVFKNSFPEANLAGGLIDLCEENILPHFKMVEVGTAIGSSARIFSEYCASLITIDNFEFLPDTIIETKRTIEALHNTFLLVGDSRKIVNKFMVNSIDAVYIDARHGYEDCKIDLSLWAPKVKLAGVICGHDYNAVDWPGVIQAVHEFAGSRYSVKTYKDTSWAMVRK